MAGLCMKKRFSSPTPQVQEIPVSSIPSSPKIPKRQFDRALSKSTDSIAGLVSYSIGS